MNIETENRAEELAQWLYEHLMSQCVESNCYINSIPYNTGWGSGVMQLKTKEPDHFIIADIDTASYAVTIKCEKSTIEKHWSNNLHKIEWQMSILKKKADNWMWSAIQGTCYSGRLDEILIHIKTDCQHVQNSIEKKLMKEIKSIKTERFVVNNVSYPVTIFDNGIAIMDYPDRL